MRQFFNESTEAFAELARRMESGCIVFRDQEMPPGAQPARARVAFEGAGAGTVRLLVDRGIRCTAAPADVRRWLEDGHAGFDSMDDLRRWLREVLAPCYGASEPAAPPRQTTPALTDMHEVRRRVSSQRPAGLRVPEEELLAGLRLRVRGQDAALRTLAHRVSLHLAQTAPARPATLFAVGPTGVGKTSAAEALPAALEAACAESSGYDFLRLDMSEYQERHRVSQLVGSPQGYLGYGDGAQLSDQLARNPRTIVLFDEIEKAHPDILRLLMNAMDAGRLSRSSGAGDGREISCPQAVFIFTSNLNARSILTDLESKEELGVPAEVNRVCRNRLKAAGVPAEIVGRIGAFLVFKPLDDAVRAEVIVLSIERVAARYGVAVEYVEPGVVVQLFEQLRDDDFGARPSEYLVDDLLGAHFAGIAARGGSARVRISGEHPFLVEPVAQNGRMGRCQPGGLADISPETRTHGGSMN